MDENGNAEARNDPKPGAIHVLHSGEHAVPAESAPAFERRMAAMRNRVVDLTRKAQVRELFFDLVGSFVSACNRDFDDFGPEPEDVEETLRRLHGVARAAVEFANDFEEEGQ